MMQVMQVLQVLLFVLPMIARAANCGGSVPCHCGDTLSLGNLTLAGDAYCPNKTALHIGSSRTLDCHGATIRGNLGPDTYGIKFVGHNGTLKRCHITGFGYGVGIISGGDGNTIQDGWMSQNGAFGKGYGIHLGPNTCRTKIRGVSVVANADEGIHITGTCTTTTRNEISHSTVSHNGREEIYLLDAQTNLWMHDVTIADPGGKAGVFIKNSSFNVLDQNTYTSVTIEIVGNSNRNTIRWSPAAYVKLVGTSDGRPDGNMLDGLQSLSVYEFVNPGINNDVRNSLFIAQNPNVKCSGFAVAGTNYISQALSPVHLRNDWGVNQWCLTER